ncbi:MAG: endonuclease/exonuclease/phosphatase family protein [Gammaproteobacteria bacterium]|nr:endonuclease/exonuclease/phosphatase family protein [Gammaproteobacteria bacterium]
MTRYLCLLLVLFLTGCATTGSLRDGVTIMTFNVENLFDTRDDPGKNDSTYLPLTQKQSAGHRAQCELIEVQRWREQCLYWDWNDEIVATKMARIAATILQVNNGRGPDIVALQEVENLAVLDQLRTQYLGAAEYQPAVLLEGKDLRGIDVAFLSRLPLVGEPVLHDIEFTGIAQERVDDTRGILEATFRLPDDSLLTAYAVHFPAPYHPREMREQAYDRLNELRSALPPDRYVFAAGDFNTTALEMRDHDMLPRYVHPQWIAVHELGCGSDCRGTHYYAPNDSWSFLDMIIWSAPEKAGWRVDPDSVRLVNEYPSQRTAEGTPNRFQMPAATGVSDHWPLAMTIRRQ